MVKSGALAYLVHSLIKYVIEFDYDYPLRPPRVRCTTRIFHPNIATSGLIALDLLGDKWNPGVTIQKG